MDVLAVVKKDGDLWQIGGVASTERAFFFCIFAGEEKGQRDSLCPCEVYFEIGGDVVADEGLGAVSKGVVQDTGKKTRTATSSAADRETGLVRWSRYRTLTF